MGPLAFIRAIAVSRLWSRSKAVGAAIDPRARVTPYPALSDKVQGRLTRKTKLTDSVYEFEYELDRAVDCLPGQYARIRHGEADYGSYSIVSCAGGTARFLIDTKQGWNSAKYFVGLAPGDHSTMRMPVGDFVLRSSDNRKAFVSTGTGLAPLLPMMAELERQGYTEEVDVYFGCRYRRDNFAGPLLDRFRTLRTRMVVCVSGEVVPGAVHGRVTVPLGQLTDRAANTDFYVAGNPAMVTSVRTLLHSIGAGQVYTECY
jgi:NAD(P)H-flavin reductase